MAIDENRRRIPCMQPITIHLTGSSNVLKPPYDSGVLAFSNGTGGDALVMAGSSIDFEGLLYAPNGTVQTNGSSNATLNGAVVALRIKLNGSSLNINGTLPYTGEGGLALVE